jgi:hypothetical protein
MEGYLSDQQAGRESENTGDKCKNKVAGIRGLICNTQFSSEIPDFPILMIVWISPGLVSQNEGKAFQPRTFYSSARSNG